MKICNQCINQVKDDIQTRATKKPMVPIWFYNRVSLWYAITYASAQQLRKALWDRSNLRTHIWFHLQLKLIDSHPENKLAKLEH